MSSATDTIRAMLDERGVEWRGGLPTETMVEADGLDLLYVALPDGRVRAFIRNYLTPEQAIEVTLGRGECQLKRANWDDGTCTWGCICSACDAHLEHETGIGYNYCPICGAKVVRA